MTAFADRLRKALNDAGIKPIELSEKTGIPRSALSEYLSGKYEPKQINIFKMASALGVPPSFLMGVSSTTAGLATQPLHGKRIPVYGSIVAGIPIEAIEDIEDWEEIPQDWPGEFFALRVCGRSMEPKYVEGDTVILRRADDVESGRTAAVLIGRESATLKRVIKSREGVTLVAYNPDVYEPHFYSNDDVLSLPLQIIGDVIELRRKV